MKGSGSFVRSRIEPPSVLAPVLSLVPWLTLACAATNPGYGFDDDGASADATSDAATSVATTDPDPTSVGEGGELTSGADGSTTSPTAPPADSGSTSDEPGSTSTEATTASEPMEHVFHPYLTDCMNPEALDPELCASVTDPGYIQIDGDDLELGGAVVGYLAFDIVGDFDAAGVQSVVLRLTANSTDPGSPTGEIWEVEPFTHESLSMVAPGKLGAGPVGPAVGTVPQTLGVEFDLPPAVIEPGQALFLAIYTDSGDGVDYANEETATPPTLVVTAL